MTFTIDSLREGDQPALQRVCIRTGDAGQDASELFTHPELLHLVYLDAYLALAPDLVRVLRDDAGRAVGYVVGAADTRRFEERCEAEWWPALRERFPMGSVPAGTPDGALAARIHTPDAADPPLLEGYPAHLHIDLLPQAQGGGRGRALITAFCDELRSRGVPGVHLGVGSRNTNAQAFYAHLGFRRLVEQPWGVVMGLGLAPRA